jgi:hypothetical protein
MSQYNPGIVETIQITDSNTTLDLEVYHYNECYIDSPSDIKQQRGIIKKISTGESVCKTFNFTPEIISTDTNLLSQSLQNYNLEDDNIKIFKSYEGTLIRVWNYNDNWLISTHRKLSSFNSRWGSMNTYGDIFINALKQYNISFDDFLQTLDKNIIYVFLLRTYKDNRIVCNKYDLPTLFFVGAFDQQHNFYFNRHEVMISTSEQLSLKSIDDIQSYIHTIDVYDFQGLFIINSTNGDTIKIIHPDYYKLAKLRGNNPNILGRYLALKNNPTQDIIDYKNLYPEYITNMDEADNILKHIEINIFKNYISRYVYNKLAIIPPDQYNILKDVHEEYKKRFNQFNIDNNSSDWSNTYDLSSIRITQSDVRKILFNKGGPSLYYLVQNYKSRLEQYGNGNWVDDKTQSKIKTNWVNYSS